MMPLAINRRYRHLKRYRQIGEVLLRHGFGYLLQQIGLASLLSPFKRLKAIKAESTDELSLGARLRMVMEELGPTFIKFGQLMSTRPDIVPPGIINELEGLQDDVTPISFAQIKIQVEQELKRPISEVFKDFQTQPLAAASIGQVHRASLLNGTEVVIKVRRPEVEHVIATDLEIMFRLAHAIEEHWGKTLIDSVELVNYFSKMIREELDYKREARNVERFRHQFINNSHVIIPRVHWEFCTNRILTMDYIEGLKLRDQALLSEHGIDLPKLADVAASAFIEQVFIHGFYHGDPHPGNLLVTEDGKLVFLDFGIVGRLDQRTMKSLARLIVAITKQDVDSILEVFEELEAFTQRPTREVYLAINELVDEYYGKTLEELDFSTIAEDLLAFTRQYPIKLSPDLTLLVKALVTIEGVGSRLVPDFNVMEVMEPFAREWVKKNYSAEHLAGLAWEHTRDWAKSLFKLPGEVESALDMLRSGELEIQVQYSSLEKLINRLDVASNRLTAGLIIGALIVGSSFILVMGQGPKLLNVPLIGLLGYLLAGMIGIWLLMSILRSGRY